MARSSIALEKGGASDANPAALIARLQSVMSQRVGPFRTEAGLTAALAEIAALNEDLGAGPKASSGRFDTLRLDWFDARAMCLVAEAVVRGALQRRESRGAHQREDYPGLDAAWTLRQTVRLEAGRLMFDPMRANIAAAEAPP